MNRLLVVLLPGALLVSAVGCEGPQPVGRGISAPLRQRSVAPEAAFAVAEQVLAEHYVLRTRDLQTGYLETAPLETVGPQRSGRLGDALGMPRRLRQYAKIRGLSEIVLVLLMLAALLAVVANAWAMIAGVTGLSLLVRAKPHSEKPPPSSDGLESGSQASPQPYI